MNTYRIVNLKPHEQFAVRYNGSNAVEILIVGERYLPIYVREEYATGERWYAFSRRGGMASMIWYNAKYFSRVPL